MENYAEILERSYEHFGADGGSQSSRLEYLADFIFDFITYESEMAELFASKMVQVCKAISEKKTFEYIATDDGRMWYLLMANMPFLDGRLNWGTSIRGAWWDSDIQLLDTCGLVGVDGEQQCEWEFPPEAWEKFIQAVVMFAAKEDEQA